MLGASIHSRAVRRATSPGIDTDKSLKEVQPPAESKSNRPSILAAHQGAGVTKRSKNGRKSVLSAKAKRRHEKGLDRAEAVMDKKVTRVEKSRGRARTVQERAKAWEEQNKKIAEKKAREEAEALEKENDTGSDLDEDMHEDVEIGEAPAGASTTVPQQGNLPGSVEEDDEIL